MRFRNSAYAVLLCSCAGLLFAPAMGGTIPKDEAQLLGTSAAHVPGATQAGPRNALLIRAFKTYANASYGTGGVALRNRTEGVIHISGVTGVAQDAWLYWGMLYSGTAASSQTITITRLYPSGAPARRVLTATLIGTGADPCWGSSGNAIYRAHVPKNIATGNGAYLVTLNPKAIGYSTGEDPWDGNIFFPLEEGASLVIVGTGPSAPSYHVSIYDKPLAGTEFVPVSGALSYTLRLPNALSGLPVLFDSIGADGQIGTSRQANNGNSDADEQVFVNGVQISGPGGNDPDGDWNGNSGAPLPQLWDDRGHDISNAVPSGTTALKVSIANSVTTGNGDCLVGVANVVGY